MDNEKKVHQAMGLDSQGSVSYFTARIKQLHTALEFAEKQIRSGKRWDAECEKIISEALSPTSLPEGFTLYEP